MLWFVSNVGNVSNDGRLAGLVIGAKSDRGRVHSYPLLISTLDSSRLGGGIPVTRVSNGKGGWADLIL